MAIAARICPNDVRLTPEQAIPGGMSLEGIGLKFSRASSSHDLAATTL